jgi:hypothetical protein
LRRELSLKEVVPVLQNTYQGSDIRAAIGRQNDKDEWTYIFLKIGATSDSKSEIESILETKLAKLAIQQKQNFRFLAEYRTISELDSIIDGNTDIISCAESRAEINSTFNLGSNAFSI